jgi:hypothetical protein
MSHGTLLTTNSVSRSGNVPDENGSVTTTGYLPPNGEPDFRKQDVVQFMSAVKRMDPADIVVSPLAPGEQPPPGPVSTSQPQGDWNVAPIDKYGQNLNAAYDAASYGNTNWDQFNFSTEEMNMFDVYMNNSGYMGYLL